MKTKIKIVLFLMGTSFLFAHGQNVVVNGNLLVQGKMGIFAPLVDRLCVNGCVWAKEVIADPVGWPDYVFEKDYKLLSLAEVEAYIEKQGHLPGIPTAAEVSMNGLDLAETCVGLLQKVEELTLYLIAQDKELNAQDEEISSLKEKLDNLQQKME